jgi:hypothetical protein
LLDCWFTLLFYLPVFNHEMIVCSLGFLVEIVIWRVCARGIPYICVQNSFQIRTFWLKLIIFMANFINFMRKSSNFIDFVCENQKPRLRKKLSHSKNSGTSRISRIFRISYTCTKFCPNSNILAQIDHFYGKFASVNLTHLEHRTPYIDSGESTESLLTRWKVQQANKMGSF